MSLPEGISDGELNKKLVKAILEIFKYLYIVLMGLYVLEAFLTWRKKAGTEKKPAFVFMEFLTYLFLISGMVGLALARYDKGDEDTLYLIAGLGAAELFMMFIVKRVMHLIYKHCDELLLCNMNMLLSVGFVELARLNSVHARKQFSIILVSMVLFLFIPAIIRHLSFLKMIWPLYCLMGAGLLLVVLLGGSTVYGAKININVLGVTFQPSEAVKLIFAFLIAGLLYKTTEMKRIYLSAVIAAAYMLILVASRDLGSALIFFVMYVTMLHISSGKRRFLFAGAGLLVVAGALAYLLFSHVRVRVDTWLDPWADIDNKGYQLTQSLFGIATGGWFGMGLGHGSPKTIPFVEDDFVFSAIAEEFGVFFGLLLILLCLNIVLSIFRLSGRLHDSFYRVVAAGLAAAYGTQVMLTIGGGTRFLPLTGVTLPLISNGGTSALCSIVMFAILQGVWFLDNDEGEEKENRILERRKILRSVKQQASKEKKTLDEVLDIMEEEDPDTYELLFSDEEEVADDETRIRQNRELSLCYVLYAVLYLCMFANIAVFVIFHREEVVPNSYNGKLLAILAEDNERGMIISSDGERLAYNDQSDEGSERVYPFGQIFAHGVGYASHGGMGVESLANMYLLTSDISLYNKLMNDMDGKKDAGNNVYTTLDSRLQKAAYDAMQNRRGAVIVTEVATGRILCMQSNPGFDPADIDYLWDRLINEDDSGRLLNRATQGMYPPGSTFKLLTALEYIRENPADYNDFEFDCSGSYTNDGAEITCFHGKAHGEQDLKTAFANSCNSAFAEIGLSLDLNSFGKTVSDFGFNDKLPVDMLSSISRIEIDEDMDTNAVMQTAIGQSKTLVSPLHINMITAAIATDGNVMKPYLLDKVVTADGRIIKEYKPQQLKKVMDENETEILTELMEEVVNTGTGKVLKDKKYSVAGKTGSAEYSDSDKQLSHAWFTGFAPADKPEIAVTVILEGGGSGGTAAAPVAGAVMDGYFESK
ncbi:MAG: FtsW/RodA/SpoVE family cell cycle protein [Lachnospiraceae bacterium]|nr:FtsW/RodA/SpoVE family cell cycle protein [Lachnospiraceae bacterium]